jgi:hypothetical protein
MTLSPTTRHRLDIQGLVDVEDRTLAEVGHWVRFPYAMCTATVAVGTALASPWVLYSLVPIAIAGAATPVHPFDHLYNDGVRRLTKTPPLPKRGAPTRFACGLGAAWVLATGLAFQLGAKRLGYALGGVLAAVGTLVSTTDICVPSMVYGALFGKPERREACAS